MSRRHRRDRPHEEHGQEQRMIEGGRGVLFRLVQLLGRFRLRAFLLHGAPSIANGLCPAPRPTREPAVGATADAMRPGV